MVYPFVSMTFKNQWCKDTLVILFAKVPDMLVRMLPKARLHAGTGSSLVYSLR